MKIPFFALDRQFERYGDEMLSLAQGVWSTGQVLQGPPVAKLETELCEATQRKHAVAVGSCTDALAFALISQGVGPGDEVLITSLSFFASVSPILRVGATPVFVDIDDFFMMDLDAMDALVTDKTKAVLAVHIYGQTMDMSRVEAFADKHGLRIIEDAAQALCARDGTRPGGNMGHVSCISFDPTKVIGAFGSGGIVVTDDDETAKQVRMMRYHGRNEERRYEILGFNSQLPSAQAALLSLKLRELPKWEERRQEIANAYLSGLEGIGAIQLPSIRKGSSHNWHKFVIRTEGRDALRSALGDAGVKTMIHYPRVLCDEPLIQSRGIEAEVPRARQATGDVLSLPIFPELTAAEVEHVVGTIGQYFAGR